MEIFPRYVYNAHEFFKRATSIDEKQLTIETYETVKKIIQSFEKFDANMINCNRWHGFYEMGRWLIKIYSVMARRYETADNTAEQWLVYPKKYAY